MVGHGTHVASIVAGSGAASGGARGGIAPGVSLLSGKVCAPFGCAESSILAGIEWAVDHGADIVNLSLGGTDRATLDPLEDAINRLSASHGTLFVVASGNSGSQPGTVSSPSSADAALSVGAVDRTGQRAPFSGQGPRVGDKAIKPDLTAPGVGIIAARAAGTSMGTPVDDAYTAASGTSMSTPHVAGAAALLSQQHPSWTGAQLKDALMSTARPNASLTVYQQGAGMIDLDRATGQMIGAQPGSLSLGVARYPHEDDPPISRNVRYVNRGGEAVTLALAGSLATLEGAPAPAEMLTSSPSTLEVPAGGAAEATITVDTRVAAANGTYGGALIATGDGVRLITPFGVEREPESYDLTVRVVGAAGQPTFGGVSLYGTGPAGAPARGVRMVFQSVFGEETFRVPAGEYVVQPVHLLEPVFTVAPHTVVSADTSVVSDARAARPIELDVQVDGLSLHGGFVGFFEERARVSSASLSFHQLLATAQLGPNPPPQGSSAAAFIFGFDHAGAFERTERYHGVDLSWSRQLTEMIPSDQFPGEVQAVANISHQIDAVRATYRVEVEAVRAPALFELSTEVRVAWTFQEQAGTDAQILPLPTLRFSPALDRHNQTAARQER